MCLIDLGKRHAFFAHERVIAARKTGDERARPGHGRNAHADRGGHIDQAKARHHAPQSEQAILGEGALEVKRRCVG